MKKALAIPLLVLSVLLTGCAAPGPQSKSLAENDKQVTAGRDIVVAVSQSEAKASVKPSHVAMYTGGGLIPALIDMAIEKHRATVAETTITPIRDALVDYAFDQKARDMVKHAAEQVSWFGTNKVIFTKDGTNENFTKLMDASTADQLMYNSIDYAFSDDFATLYVGLKTQLMKRIPPSSPNETANARMDYKNAAYFNTWVYHETVAGAGTDPEANVKLWADNNGARARAVLDKGLDEVGRSLVADLTKEGGAQQAQVTSTVAPQGSEHGSVTQ